MNLIDHILLKYGWLRNGIKVHWHVFKWAFPARMHRYREGVEHVKAQQMQALAESLKEMLKEVREEEQKQENR